MLYANEFFGLQQTVSFTGVVEDVQDPIQAGRVRVRCHGVHTQDKNTLPTEQLHWALVLLPVTSATIAGIGSSPNGLRPGSWVFGIFLDGNRMQQPLVLGSLPGVHKDSSVMGAAPAATAQQGSGTAQDGTTTDTGTGTTSGAEPGSGGVAGSTGGGTIDTPSGITNIEGQRSTNPRLRTDAVKGIVFHTTGGTTLSGAVSTLNSRGLSYNYIIDTDGTINQFVSPDHVAFHMKNSNKGVMGLGNRNTIGISYVGVGEGDITPAQLASGHALATSLAKSTGATQFFGHGELNTHKASTEGTTSSSYMRQNYSPTPTSYPTALRDDMTGFQDPNQQFPRWPGEDHSTHPYARGFNTDYQWSEDPYNLQNTLNQDAWRTIPTAGGGMWDEPMPPNVGQYPMTQTYVQESGAITAYDSTPGAERFLMYHPDGSYSQVDHEGNYTHRAEGDSVEFSKGHKRIAAMGDFAITSQGSMRLMSESDAHIEIKGGFRGVFNSALDLNVAGTLTLNATGGVRISGASVTIEATGGNIDMKTPAEIGMEAGQDLNMQSGQDIVLDAGGSQVQKAAGDIVSHADGDVKQEAGGNINVKAGGKIAEEGASYHNNSPEARFKTIRAENIGVTNIAWAHTPSDSAGTGNSGSAVPVTAPDAPESAEDAMTEISNYNSQRSREGGSSGNNIAPATDIDGGEDYKAAENRSDPVKVDTKPVPTTEDVPLMLEQMPTDARSALPNQPGLITPGAASNWTVNEPGAIVTSSALNNEAGMNNSGYTAADIDAMMGGDGYMPSRGTNAPAETVDGIDQAVSTLPPALRGDAKAMIYGGISQESDGSLAQTGGNRSGSYVGVLQQNNDSFDWGKSQLSEQFQKDIGGMGSGPLSGGTRDPALSYLGHTYDSLSYAKKVEPTFAPVNADANYAQMGRGNMAEVARIMNLYPDVKLKTLKKGDKKRGIPAYQPKYNPAFWSHAQSNPSLFNLNKSMTANRKAVHARHYDANGIGGPGSSSYSFTLWGSIMKGGSGN